MADSASTLSGFDEIPELTKGFIISCIERNEGYERHLLSFMIQRGNCFSIVKSLLLVPTFKIGEIIICAPELRQNYGDIYL